MCGIVGIAGLEHPRLIRRMADAVAHRGPDGDGYFVGDGISLGMRRLSIIDPAGSNQPIWSEDRRVLTVFNGEIYNYRTLRPFLEKHGHSFRTAGDTETVVHLYEEYGDAGVHLLRGMFAYALWDSSRRRWCWPAIVSASSRCTTPSAASAWCSPRRSRRCWPCPRSPASSISTRSSAT